jgi:hypothetical protein
LLNTCTTSAKKESDQAKTTLFEWKNIKCVACLNQLNCTISMVNFCHLKIECADGRGIVMPPVQLIFRSEEMQDQFILPTNREARQSDLTVISFLNQQQLISNRTKSNFQWKRHLSNHYYVLSAGWPKCKINNEFHPH